VLPSITNDKKNRPMTNSLSHSHFGFSKATKTAAFVIMLASGFCFSLPGLAGTEKTGTASQGGGAGSSSMNQSAVGTNSGLIGSSVPAPGSFSVSSMVPSVDSSISRFEERYASANKQQQLFDQAMQLSTTSDSAPPTAIGAIDQAGMADPNADNNGVVLGQVQTMVQEDQKATMAGNMPQQNLAGVTYNADGEPSHFGPPTSYDIVFQYVAPFYVDAAPYFGSQAAAVSSFQGAPPTLGIRATDTSNQIMLLNIATKFADQALAPSRWYAPAQAMQQAIFQQASEASATAAEDAFQSSLSQAGSAMTNVANENAAQPGSPSATSKTLPQVIWMVQQMYKQCYIPMAVLLLLPGALLTQMKGMVSYGILNQAEDSEVNRPNPFSGILRSIIAIFLIPATQLIISWAIDIGNSMTSAVAQNINDQEVIDWAKEQTFNAPPSNSTNTIEPSPVDIVEAGPSGSGVVIGKATDGAEEQSQVETQSRMTQILQALYNLANLGLGSGLAALLGFQEVMMCYLLLLGPIAAALYAWPSGVGSLFNKIFPNWINAVITLALWRFWWCVVILCMDTRIQWLKELGAYAPNSQWEMMMYTSFMTIMMYVPFSPFQLSPGGMVSQLIQEAQSATGNASGVIGSGGSSGSGGGSSSSAPASSGASGTTGGSGGAAGSSGSSGSSGGSSGSGSSSAGESASSESVSSPPSFAPESAGASESAQSQVAFATPPPMTSPSAGSVSSPPGASIAPEFAGSAPPMA
jgi:hypothetical protein